MYVVEGRFFFPVTLLLRYLDEGVVRDIVYVVLRYVVFLRNEKGNKMQFIIGGITKFHESRRVCCTFFSPSLSMRHRISG